MTTILDSSAVLALLWQETGHEIVAAALDNATISAVNLAEVYSKFAERGIDGETARALLLDLQIRIASFDEHQAMIAGDLRQKTRALGLSLGDRACLGLAISEVANILTADRVWLELDLGIDIKSIR